MTTVTESATSSPVSLLKTLIGNVLSSEKGRKLLTDNPIDQIFVFEQDVGGPFMMQVVKGSTEIQVMEGSKAYSYPTVLLCKASTKTLTELFSGKLRVGRAYVDNIIELRGQLLAKAFLGNLVRLNQELMNPSFTDAFKYAP